MTTTIKTAEDLQAFTACAQALQTASATLRQLLVMSTLCQPLIRASDFSQGGRATLGKMFPDLAKVAEDLVRNAEHVRMEIGDHIRKARDEERAASWAFSQAFNAGAQAHRNYPGFLQLEIPGESRGLFTIAVRAMERLYLTDDGKFNSAMLSVVDESGRCGSTRTLVHHNGRWYIEEDVF